MFGDEAFHLVVMGIEQTSGTVVGRARQFGECAGGEFVHARPGLRSADARGAEPGVAIEGRAQGARKEGDEREGRGREEEAGRLRDREKSQEKTQEKEPG